jgi:antitoxin component YwqK of YwqJK toxin-antitoxin module
VKYLIPVLCAVALLAGCAKEKKDPDVVDAPKVVVETPKVVVDDEKLKERDGLMCFEEKPFTGVGVSKYPKGQKLSEYTYQDGLMHGLQTEWRENGQKQWEVTSKDGNKDGLETGWHENGQKRFEATWKDDEEISYKKWDKDGNLVTP